MLCGPLVDHGLQVEKHCSRDWFSFSRGLFNIIDDRCPRQWVMDLRDISHDWCQKIVQKNNRVIPALLSAFFTLLLLPRYFSLVEQTMLPL